MTDSITQCPECSTRFKVTSEQLNASEGIVRCGRCHAVFNATEHFYSDEPSPQLDLPISANQDEVSTSSVADEDESTNGPLTTPTVTDSIIAEPQHFDLEPTVQTEETPPPSKKNRGWLWASGSLFFMLLLVAQILYFFRVEIAARLPGTKPALMKYCQVLKCSIPLPKDPDLMSIESSDLEADATHAHIITLTALLHNRADYTQAYPSLELTLTDVQDQIVARRTFTPKEYLAPSESEHLGLAANREMSAKLHLDTADLKPTGYKLFLFYP